jgi:hypothetical protein
MRGILVSRARPRNWDDEADHRLSQDADSGLDAETP